MRIVRIEYDDNEMPTAITTSMGIAEAAFITKIVGRITPKDAEAVMPDGWLSADDIYGCLAGNVFNRHWEDGINDYPTTSTEGANS